MVITRRKSYGTSGSPSTADSTAAVATAASSPDSDNSNSNDSKGTSPRLGRKISDIDKNVTSLFEDLEKTLNTYSNLAIDNAARGVHSARIAKTYIELLDLLNERLNTTNEDNVFPPSSPSFGSRTLDAIDKNVLELYQALQVQLSEVKDKKKSKKKGPGRIDFELLEESIVFTRMELREFVQERVRTQQASQAAESVAGLATAAAARLARASIGSTPAPHESENINAGTSAGVVSVPSPANNSRSGSTSTLQRGASGFGDGALRSNGGTSLFGGNPSLPNDGTRRASTLQHSGTSIFDGDTPQSNTPRPKFGRPSPTHPAATFADASHGFSASILFGQEQMSTQATGPTSTSFPTFGEPYPTTNTHPVHSATDVNAGFSFGAYSPSYEHATAANLAEAGLVSRSNVPGASSEPSSTLGGFGGEASSSTRSGVTGSNAFGDPSPSPAQAVERTTHVGASTTSAPTPSLFGPGSTPGGSSARTNDDFVPTPAVQEFGQNPIVFQSITAMPRNSDTSFEELRFQHYQAQQEAAQQQAPAARDTADSRFSVQAAAPDASRVRFSLGSDSENTPPSSNRGKRRAQSTPWARN